MRILLSQTYLKQPPNPPNHKSETEKTTLELCWPPGPISHFSWRCALVNRGQQGEKGQPHVSLSVCVSLSLARCHDLPQCTPTDLIMYFTYGKML